MITEFKGKKVSPIGIGTWGMGGWVISDRKRDEMEINGIKYAIKNGLNFIDTAEFYGRGHAEELVGSAIRGMDRESLFITTKIWPTHLSYEGIVNAAKASIQRMQCNYIDLYLIHWPNPLANVKEAMRGMEGLIDLGLARNIGVSNYGISHLRNAMDAMKKYEIAANQIEYSLLAKGCEKEVIPFCEKNKITVIAYTPLGKGRVGSIKKVRDVAEKYNMTPIQIALRYLMKRSLPIPKATSKEHWDELLGALKFELRETEYELLKETV